MNRITSHLKGPRILSNSYTIATVFNGLKPSKYLEKYSQCKKVYISVESKLCKFTFKYSVLFPFDKKWEIPYNFCVKNLNQIICLPIFLQYFFYPFLSFVLICLPIDFHFHP